MKAALTILLALSVGLNVFQGIVAGNSREVIRLQDVAILADKAYWEKVNSTPVLLWKHRETGNLFVGVPYRDKPFAFKGVCMQERKL